MCDIINKSSQKTKSSGLLCTGTGTVFLEYRVGTPVLFFIISGENDTIWLLQFIGTGSGGQKIKNCKVPNTVLTCLKLLIFVPQIQGCGSGAAWIRIHFRSCIRIRIQYADPDPGV